LPGTSIILWTIRAACISYAAALAALIAGRHRVARTTWTAGCALYLAHVWSAFEYKHHWSHASAVAETARQTGELFGLYWGGGVWFNYLFTLVWLGDAAWWWMDASSYRQRSVWIASAVHGYLAFMFFQGAVVFAHGPVRWLSAAVCIVLGVAWGRKRLGARRAALPPAP
jgi:hypothetical protein